MAGKLTTTDFDSQFAQLARASTALGVDTDEWTLVSGEEQVREMTRTPWFIADGTRHPVVVLGYTSRDAMSALSVLNAYAAVLERA